MTQEEKQILFKNLCAMLPYDVIVEYGCKHEGKDLGERKSKLTGRMIDSFFGNITIGMSEVYSLQPYLRPMESMTEEEMGEYAKFKLSYDDVYEFTDFRATGKGFINVNTSCKNGGVGYTFQVNNRTMLYDGVIGIDWLNAHHFDFRGLIEKGLALSAPEGMYKTD